MSNKYFLLSLGCSKNTVDSQSMAQLMDESGYAGVDEPGQASVLIVNTCGFIGPARDESVQNLRELAESKKRNQILIAAGCLSQIWGQKLVQEVPGLDGIIGTRRWMDIVEFVEQVRGRRTPEPMYHLPGEATVVGSDEHGARRVAVQGASAYIKIADGCRRPCAFCSIPRIKGTAVSRPPQAILAEAKELAARGVRELVLIAQDTTDYGHDLGLQDPLPNLLESICEAAPQVKWVRLMYAYPGAVSDQLIEVMATRPQIVHYLDIPLQHGHPDMLRRMRRPANVDWVYRTLGKLRAAMPDMAIRTTFIVGYPGETGAEFDTLCQFVGDLKFDRVGAFTYSFEPGTPSAELPDHVPDEIKQERYERLMALQQPISLSKNQSLVGQTLDVLIEGQGDGLTVGRTYRDAPEIDGLVIIEGDVPPSEFVPVRITGAMEYDLTGTVDLKPLQVIQHRKPKAR
jgi:ribosomal protein S12 methylthiotransferase